MGFVTGASIFRATALRYALQQGLDGLIHNTRVHGVHPRSEHIEPITPLFNVHASPTTSDSVCCQPNPLNPSLEALAAFYGRPKEVVAQPPPEEIQRHSSSSGMSYEYGFTGR